MKIKQRVLLSIIILCLASAMTACSGSKKIVTAPLRDLSLSPPPAKIIKDHYTFVYETVHCADTQQFLITDTLFSISAPEKAIKIDFRQFSPTAPEPKTRKVFSVLFPVNSCVMDTNEAEKLLHFIDELKRDPTGPVDMTGYTCRLGSVEYNKKLALNRAKTVSDELKKQGIRVRSVIGKAGCCYISKSDPAQNRRVEITVSQLAKQSVTENQEGGDPGIR